MMYLWNNIYKITLIAILSFTLFLSFAMMYDYKVKVDMLLEQNNTILSDRIDIGNTLDKVEGELLKANKKIKVLEGAIMYRHVETEKFIANYKKDHQLI